jgi:DNA (cytosine-5)-methyltransferase 1
MFFEIQRIIAEKRPKAFMLENVKQLRGHEKGRTLQTILAILEGRNGQELSADIPMSEDARDALSNGLNYQVFCCVLRAADFCSRASRFCTAVKGSKPSYNTL